MTRSALDQTSSLEIQVLVELPNWSRFDLEERPTALSLDIDEAFANDVRPYQVAAERLKDHVEVRQLASRLANVVAKDIPPPFVVLKNSSGTGKTQMAFNLQASGACDVVYVVCGKQGEIEQRVYNAFSTRSKTFQLCVERDLSRLDTGSVPDISGTQQLHLYGFIRAALRGDTVVDGPAQRLDVTQELQLRHERGAKPCVFFIDELPHGAGLSPVGSKAVVTERSARDKYLRTMRNVFQSFPLAAVVSSTNGTARNLVSGGRSRPSEPFQWCVVFPSLPAVACNDEIEDARVPEQLKRIMRRSRPLFVNIALECARHHPYTGDGNVLRYLDKMADHLAPRFCRLKRQCEAFELGQLGLVLGGASYALVDDEASAIDSHFARLRETEAFELVLGADCMLSNDGANWVGRCAFPPPDEDMLLHLVLTGGRTFHPLREPLHVMIKAPHVQALMQRSDPDQQRPDDGMGLDALVCAAAVVLVSHRGGFGGVQFPTFLRVLLRELGVCGPQEQVQLPWDASNAEITNLSAPFLSVPNVVWPDWLLHDRNGTAANFDNLYRTQDEDADHVDFRIASNLMSAECKDYSSSGLSLPVLQSVLERMPDESTVHLVVTKQIRD